MKLFSFFSWELWLALRYVLSPKRERFTGIISLIAIIGVTLSVAALTTVNAVITGFKEVVTEKVISLNPHISITYPNLEIGAKIFEIIKQEIPEKELVSVRETAAVQGLLIVRSQPVGIILKGTTLETIKKEKGFRNLVVDETLINKEDEFLPILIGKKLKEKTGLEIGDSLNFMTAEGVFTPFGFFPRIFLFKVVGYFDTGIYDFDLNLVFTDKEKLLNKINPKTRTTEIKLRDPFKSHVYRDKLSSRLGWGIMVIDWQEWNKNLFAALKMEKIGLFVVLTLMIMVSLFTIVAAMVMLVSEKKMDIGILKALGVSSKQILKIFFYCGLVLSLTGVLLGLTVGGLLCALLSHYPVVKLPTDVYPVEYMPVSLKKFDILIISLTSVGISIIACLYPAKKASEIMPAEILRHG